MFIDFFLIQSTSVWAAEIKTASAAAEKIESSIFSFADHTLLIFLDDSEDREDILETITGNFVQALLQKPCPILVSHTLLQHVWLLSNIEHFKTAYKDRANKQLRLFQLVQDTLNDLIGSKKITDQKEKQDIARQLNQKLSTHSEFAQAAEKDREVFNPLFLTSSFNPQEWSIYRVNENLDLLIPKSYAPKRVPDMAKTGDLSKAELELGLKVDHLKKISEKEFPEFINKKNTISDSYFIDVLWGELYKKLRREQLVLDVLADDIQKQKETTAVEFYKEEIQNTSIKVTQLQQASIKDSLFVTRSEYKEHGIDVADMPQWAIYINGHGTINSTVSSLSIRQFKHFLYFLDHKIVTKLFVYQSCYASGTNSTLIYKDLTQGIDKTYTFPIIAISPSDAPVFSITVEMNFSNIVEQEIDFPQKKLRVFPYYDFNEFVRNVTSSGTLNFYEKIEPIVRFNNPRISEFLIEKYPNQAQIYIKWFRSNIAQLKLPYLEWFNVLDSANSIASIGRLLAATRSPESPLYLSSFFRKAKQSARTKVVLLYASVIPFELVVDVPKCPSFLSMIPGQAVHIMRKLSMKRCDFKQFQDSFDIFRYGARKIFMVHECLLKNETISNVIIDIFEKDIKIFYTKNSEQFLIRDSKTTKLSTSYLDDYEFIQKNPAIIKELELQKQIDELKQVLTKKRSVKS